MDKYQGQQNDYILLSLVRTKNVGHIRDVRRLVVALSRARLGLYVFSRTAVFNTCHELAPAFKQLMSRPQQLVLLPKEEYPTDRLNDQVSFDGEIVTVTNGPSIKISSQNTDTTRSIVTITHMPEMVDFVYKLYGQKIEEWKVSKPHLFAPQRTEIEVVKEEEQVETTQENAEEVMEEEEFGFEPLAEDDTGIADQEIDLQEFDTGEEAKE